MSGDILIILRTFVKNCRIKSIIKEIHSLVTSPWYFGIAAKSINITQTVEIFLSLVSST